MTSSSSTMLSHHLALEPPHLTPHLTGHQRGSFADGFSLAIVCCLLATLLIGQLLSRGVCPLCSRGKGISFWSR